MDLTILAWLAVVVPVVIVIGWVASWWWPWWLRWGTLAILGVTSAGCLAYGLAAPPRPVYAKDPCAGLASCAPPGVGWMAGGLVAVALVALLALGGLIIEIARWTKRSRAR